MEGKPRGDVEVAEVRAFLASHAPYDALPDAADRVPQVIVADTVKGRGVRAMEYSPDWHVGNLVGEDYDDVLAEIAAGLRPLEARA